MAIVNLYSKRKRAKNRPADDVFSYDEASDTLRTQILQMFEEAAENYDPYRSRTDTFAIDPDLLANLVKALRREYGLRKLTPRVYDGEYLLELVQFISECDTDEFLDCVELFCRIVSNDKSVNSAVKEDLIAEVNHRLREAGLGYEYDKEIVRIDSKLVHGSVVKPVIHLLSSDPFFAGAESEFFSAFSHFKDGKHKEAIADALKSFESTMKSILTKRKWQFGPNDTASKLLQACFNHGLVPTYLQTQFTSLKSLLESGVPTVRNKTSGHGQGVSVQNPDEHLTSFALYMTAINIKFLIECDAALP
ncbi:hypothetical protein BMG03_04075 [Thioclava nitratireducens]|uniref:Abortive infection protein-like C-terminal domain-containing protein n=1 Tax=Thioclava nitratireducens TaxID=1915078 RepID=A0ABM6IEG8_9RHOB|nr:hypothetical protein [Thioclava nitratireducens]AQS47065.1 hypothetical protein BMG03_04075 [Thioclava nitratireducens]